MPIFTKEQIKEIAGELDCGLKAYYHKQNGELIFVPDTESNYDLDEEAWQEELDKLENNFTDYQEIQAMASRDSFEVMELFASQLEDSPLKEKLFISLNGKHPFRYFKYEIDNSGEFRDMWFDFKNKSYLNWVEQQLESHKRH